MTRKDFEHCRCDGWWEQVTFGRQPMADLQITFEDHRLQGSGIDIVGSFTMMGVISQGAAVVIRKQYVGRHSVEYHGTYDGEGVMTGEWRLDEMRGRWMIAIRRGETNSSADIVEFVPK